MSKCGTCKYKYNKGYSDKLMPPCKNCSTDCDLYEIMPEYNNDIPMYSIVKWNDVNEILPPDDKLVIWICEAGHISYTDIHHDMDDKELKDFLTGPDPERGTRLTHWAWPPYPNKE